MIGRTTYHNMSMGLGFYIFIAYIFSILLGRAVDDGQAATDKVILDINNDKGRLGFHNLEKDFWR